VYRNLLEQARHLVRREPRKPRQVSLRRAVSSAYYALFHFLIDRACRQVFGGSPRRRQLRLILSRAFVHGAMREASRRVAGGNLPQVLGWTTPFPPRLQAIARAFVRLQEERHRADYDLSQPVSRTEADGLVEQAATAIADWPAIADDDAARLYLVLLLAWKGLEQR
jgi:hypothetical protein